MSSPFDSRYGSKTMRAFFSSEYKFSTWRKLWVALAKAERDLGLNITEEQIKEMADAIYMVDLELASNFEKYTKHDVVAHIRAFGKQCPTAEPIIHLGATSCYVTDNTDVIQQRNALLLTQHRLAKLINVLRIFAEQYTDTPTTGFTHYQLAQPTTVGKRACMWIQDFVMDLDELEHQLLNLKMLGCKGATGTSASFLELFDGDQDKVRELERRIKNRFGFTSVYPISGQTYTRKQDFNVLQVLSGIAQSASKFANDIRLLSNLKEITEYHSAEQVGSSAMPYKVNPITCEKVNSLSRLVICNLQTCAMNTATQWLERTLDDSANRRVVIPETFMAIDEILLSCLRIAQGLTVNRDVIEEHYTEALPLFITEPILMLLVKKGGNRQELHEELRKVMTMYEPSELRTMLVHHFDLTAKELYELEHGLTGLAAEQASEYLSWVSNRLTPYEHSIKNTYE